MVGFFAKKSLLADTGFPSSTPTSQPTGIEPASTIPYLFPLSVIATAFFLYQILYTCFFTENSKECWSNIFRYIMNCVMKHHRLSRITPIENNHAASTYSNFTCPSWFKPFKNAVIPESTFMLTIQHLRNKPPNDFNAQTFSSKSSLSGFSEPSYLAHQNGCEENMDMQSIETSSGGSLMSLLQAEWEKEEYYNDTPYENEESHRTMIEENDDYRLNIRY